MSHREDETHLRDMLDYAGKAVEAIRGCSRADLDCDAVLGAALERFVEIIGEAANRVQDERRRAMPDVPWKQIVGMRNRLIHGYIAVDLDILWNVVHDDLPALIERLEKEFGTSA